VRYPTTLQYLESLTNPEGLFRCLEGVKIIAGGDGEALYSSGNFGTVFKVSTPLGNKALKCFTRIQHGRPAAYQQISHDIGSHLSQYIIDYRLLDNELFVFNDEDSGKYYPILVMDWVEGETLTREIKKAARAADKHKLTELSEAFDRMALWLLAQPFAHGDIKPDNIMVRPDGSLVLIDYDGIFLPGMLGEQSRENGTPSFQHPLREGNMFDKHIDDYSIAFISVILRALGADPSLWIRHNDGESFTMIPREIFEGTSACWNDISATPLGKTTLFGLLKSDTPVIEGIAEALAGKPRTETATLAVAESTVMPAELFLYKHKGRYGFLDDAGNPAIGCDFERARDFAEGLAAVMIEGKWGYIDTAGKVVIPPIYQYAGPFAEGLASVSLSGKYGYIDSRGKAVGTFKFDDSWTFRQSLGLVRRETKYGFVGKDGLMAIPARFDGAQSFSEGKACVMEGGKYGFIDTRGRWIIKPFYTYATSAHDGKAYVEMDEKGFLITFQ